jgi:hypothetical protein
MSRAIKVNTDPNCPGAGIASDDASLTNWDIAHKDRGKFSMSSIPKARWQEIFGPDKAKKEALKGHE